jgi:hypothetical protein
MNTRVLTVLTALAGTLALAEFGSAVIIGLGKDPWGSSFAVLFGGFFLLATWLLRSGRVGAGAIFAGILCLFEVIEFPSWHKHDVLDWVYQSAVALVALAGLIAAIAVLAARLRRRAVAEAARPGI